MRCPACTEPNLVMSDRQGIEIDYCPQCRGVWLDRGELDKIIARSTQDAPAAAPVQQSTFMNPQHSQGQNPGYAQPYGQGQHPGQHQGHNQGYAQPYGHGQQHGHHKRKKSFLEELFD